MPNMRFNTAGSYVFRYSDIEDFRIFRSNLDVIRMEYDEGRAGRPFDSERSPWRITLELEGATTFVPEDGPNAGQEVYNGGTISSVSYYSRSGDLQMRITDLDTPLALFQARVNGEDLYRMYDEFVTGGSNFSGSSAGDDIRTGWGDDVVQGRGGNDYIKDHGGSDRYVGGSGYDTVTYDEWFNRNPQAVVSGITADLRAGTVIGPDGNTDTLVSIEEIRGTHLGDTFTGNGQDNRFYGLGGEDTFDGGGGFDFISYRRDADAGGTAGAHVNMATGTARDGFGLTDTFTNIEGVQGSVRRDVFIDGAGDNYYEGREGADIFRLARGNDTAEGDEGADRFVFIGNNFGNDRIRDFNQSEGDLLIIRNAARFSNLTITENGDGDAVVSYRRSEVVLEDVAAADIGADDFLF